MDYNQELSKLISEAEKAGVTFENGKFIERKRTEDVNVIHISFNSLGCGEESYKFQLYDKMFLLTDKQVKKAEKIKEKLEVLSFLYDNEFDKNQLPDNLENVTEKHIHYFVLDNETEDVYDYYVQANFNTDYGDAGFINIFKCPFEIYRLHEQISINTYGSYLFD